MKTLVIWDLDGTLTQSKPWIFASYRYAARNSGLPEPSDEILETMCCGGLHEHIFQLFGKTGAEADRIAADYRWYYGEYCVDKVELFDGIRETLEALKGLGVDQAIATMKLESAAVDLMRRLGLEGYFVRIAGSEPTDKVTKADMIRSCVSCGDYSRVFMVGDCPSDKKAAEDTGIPFIAAAFGYGYPKKKCVEQGLEYIEEPLGIIHRI